MSRVKRIFTLVHIVLWMLFTLLVGLQLEINDGSEWLSLTAATVFTGLYIFYSHFFLLTSYQGKRKKRAYFIRLLAILVTGPLPFLFFHPRGLESRHQFNEFYFMTFFTAVPLFIFLSWLARVTETLVINTIKKDQLEKQAVQAELFYLKSQINPHFLFNTLNNIYTLVYKQAATAPEAVLKLSSLMRYMIYESNAQTVPLSREIIYLQDYISLQQLRYKENPIVDLQISGDTDSAYIAPLLFVHFIENAYKHSHARLKPGDIIVRVEVKENTLIFSIENPFVSKQRKIWDEPSGFGLVNIRKRLQLLYHDKYTLETGSTGNKYFIRLQIKDLPSVAL